MLPAELRDVFQTVSDVINFLIKLVYEKYEMRSFHFHVL